MGPEREYELHGGGDCRWKTSSTSKSDNIDLQKSEVSESDNTKIKGRLCHFLSAFHTSWATLAKFHQMSLGFLKHKS